MARQPNRSILIAIFSSLLAVAPAQARLVVGSTLTLAPVQNRQSAQMRLSIALESTGQTVFRSGRSMRFLTNSTETSTTKMPSSFVLDFGVGQNRQDHRINVVGSSGSFESAYADAETTISDIALTANGTYSGYSPFLQNIWIKTPGGGRQRVSFALKNFTYDATSGSGNFLGVFTDWEGNTSNAMGSFSATPGDNCLNAYRLNLQVLSGDVPPENPPDSPPDSPPDAPPGAPPGTPPGVPPVSPPGAPPNLTPLLGLFALIPLVSHHSGSNDNPTEQINEPDGQRPTEGHRAPQNSIPTPALLPAAIAFCLKHRRRAV
jgi:hypothetical protein